MNRIQAQAEYQRLTTELAKLLETKEQVDLAHETGDWLFGFAGYIHDPVELSDKIGALRASISQLANDILNGVYYDSVENKETIHEEDKEVEKYEIHMLDGSVVSMTEEEMEDYSIYTCCDCGELCEAETYQDTDQRMNILCNSCENNGSDYKLCSRCGYYEEHCIITEDSEQSYCNDCIDHIYQCEECGGYFEYPISVRQDDNNTTVCNHCYDYCDYVSCEECGRIVYSDDTYMHDGACYCYFCHCDIEERMGDLSNWVHDYSWKPDPNFYGGEDNDKFRIGVELEIMNGENISFCQDTEDIEEIYLKRDCSIDDGLEIVTHPMTISYFNHDFPLTDILSAAKSNGFDSHNNRKCGLHVHVDIRYLGKTQIDQKYTIAKLLLLCERFFDDKLVNFSRRTAHQLNRWCKKPQMNYDQHEDTIGVLIEKIDSKQHYEDRYQTINLQNGNTIEFRIFRGSLVEQTVRASIQLCEVLTNYAKNNDINKIQVCTWEEAVKSDYVELNAYMESRGLVEKVEPKSEDVTASVDFYTEQEIERVADNGENPFDSTMPYSEYVETLNQRETAHIIREDDSLIAPLDYIEASQIRPIDSIDVDSLFEPQSSNELDQLAIGL